MKFLAFTSTVALFVGKKELLDRSMELVVAITVALRELFIIFLIRAM
jgi:hypothetical protein